MWFCCCCCLVIKTFIDVLVEFQEEMKYVQSACVLYPEDVTVSSVWFYLTQLLPLILQRWPVTCVDVELFSVHFSKPVCDPWIPMFSSISESLALTDLTIYFSSNSFSFFFTNPSLLLLIWPCVLPSALFSSLLDSPKVQTSRTTLLQNCAGWWEGVSSSRTEFRTLPLLTMRPQRVA